MSKLTLYIEKKISVLLRIWVISTHSWKCCFCSVYICTCMHGCLLQIHFHSSPPRNYEENLTNFEFCLYQVKHILKIYMLAYFQLGSTLCFQSRAVWISILFYNAWDLDCFSETYKNTLSFWVLNDQYIKKSLYANVFKFTRENKFLREPISKLQMFH